MIYFRVGCYVNSKKSISYEEDKKISLIINQPPSPIVISGFMRGERGMVLTRLVRKFSPKFLEKEYASLHF